MSGILVIRGGAIGDFILTLPAIGLLREAFPATWIEILGYRHIVALADQRHYANATRSIEYGGLASFFIPGGKLPEELQAYFSDFDQVISYLYDPDGFFEANLRRSGVENYLAAIPKVDTGPESPHAVHQLARPLEQLALFLDESNRHPQVYLNDDDRSFAVGFLQPSTERPIVALHPGSGGAHKEWPLDHWHTLLDRLREHPSKPRLLFVGGEADGERLAALRKPEELLAHGLPLPQLAALLQKATVYLGHDSGVSHLAAAVGTPSVLLFGPTDANIWAPLDPHVITLRAPEGDLTQLMPDTVFAALQPELRKFA